MVLIATSAASRPRAISTRPMRGTLWRASKVYQRPPRIDLEPGAEIHRRRIRRHADVAEIAGAVARRDVHAAAERDGEVREVAAHAAPLGEAARGAARGVGVLIVELDVRVDEIADRLHPAPSPAACRRTAPRPCPSSGRSRSTGWRAGTPGRHGAGRPRHAARPRGRRDRACRCRRRWCRRQSAARPGGASTRTHLLPKPST